MQPGADRRDPVPVERGAHVVQVVGIELAGVVELVVVHQVAEPVDRAVHLVGHRLVRVLGLVPHGDEPRDHRAEGPDTKGRLHSQLLLAVVGRAPRSIPDNGVGPRRGANTVSDEQTGIGAKPPVAAVGEIDEIGIGMLGYAFMGKAHSNAFRKIQYMTWPPPLMPRLVAIAGRDEEAVAGAAQRYGYERWTTDWRDIVSDPSIGLFDNGGPNSLHAEPTIAAAEAGKHVLCEKPLGRDADESYDIWQRVEATGVKHLCAFNYRFVPAVRLAREMIEAGELGEIRHFRGRYLQDWGDDPTLDTWRFDAAAAGSGALGDLGAHVIDLARFLVGDISTVSALVHTFLPGRQVDDAIEAAVEFEAGAIGTIEATRLALGRRNAFQWEINGSKGSLAFDMEKLNELQVFRADGDRARGFKTVLVSEADHPFWEFWWPPGHIIGWGETFVHEIHHLLARDQGRHRRGTVRRHVRGRLPRRRGVRRDRPLERERDSGRRSATARRVTPPPEGGVMRPGSVRAPGIASARSRPLRDCPPSGTARPRCGSCAAETSPAPAFFCRDRSTVSRVTAKSRMQPVMM